MCEVSPKVQKTALAFILLMGIVSLFSDMTHEGAASILGDYLRIAGASAAAIGFITGLGGFIGYSLRLATGFLADKTKCYWPITIFGYVVDCMAIPALALIPKDGWIWACLLIVVQRMGKAIKKPAKDTILSFAATQYGTGKSFAIQEFLDQLGAFSGPVILFVVLMLKNDMETFSVYKICFAILGIPAVITVLLLLFAKCKFPNPEQFEPEPKKMGAGIGSNTAFWLFMAAISLFAFGFLGFPIITMHAAETHLVTRKALPLIYAGAMAVDAFAALAFGWLYDKFGLKILMLSTLIAAPFAALIFASGGNHWIFYIGVALWGIGMGAQESILKAAVATLIPKSRRSVGYGVFQTAFGVFFFLGSTATGYLYGFSIPLMIAVSIGTQLAAIPFFGLADHLFRKARSAEQETA